MKIHRTLQTDLTRRKHFLCVCLTSLLIASSAAAATNGQVVVNFWNPDSGDDVVRAYRESINKFEQTHPGTKVNLVNIPWSDIYAKWETAIQTGNVPDASIASAAFAASLNAQEALEPLDGVVKEMGGEEIFSPSAKTFVDVSKHNGSFITLPYVQSPVVLWYRKDLLEKNGLAVPKTWDDLLSAAKALTKDENYGVLMTSSKTYVTQQLFYSLMLADGADLVDRQTGEKVVFDSPATVEALRFYKELSRYSPAGAGGYGQAEAQAAMTTGKVAMFIYGTWLGAPLAKAGHDVADKFGAAPIPKKGGRGTFMGEQSLVVFKGGKQKAEAKEFIKFLMKDENYIRLCLVDPNTYFPVTKSSQENPLYKENPKVKAASGVIDVGEAELPNSWIYGMPNPHAGDLEGLNVISEVVGRVVLQNIEPETAVKEGAEQIKQIVSGQ